MRRIKRDGNRIYVIERNDYTNEYDQSVRTLQHFFYLSCCSNGKCHVDIVDNLALQLRQLAIAHTRRKKVAIVFVFI